MTKATDRKDANANHEASTSTFDTQGWMDQVKDQNERLMAQTQGAFAQMMHVNQRFLEEGQKMLNVQRSMQAQWVETMMGAATNLQANR